MFVPSIPSSKCLSTSSVQFRISNFISYFEFRFSNFHFLFSILEFPLCPTQKLAQYLPASSLCSVCSTPNTETAALPELPPCLPRTVKTCSPPPLSQPLNTSACPIDPRSPNCEPPIVPE